MFDVVLENKIWLETHLWHAKRMKMEDMWGYRLVSWTLIGPPMSNCEQAVHKRGIGFGWTLVL